MARNDKLEISDKLVLKRSQNWQHHNQFNLSNPVFREQPRLYGIYRGYVVDINDPYGVGRVKVFIPELMHNPDTDAIWCDPLFVSEGQHIPPFYNQVVLVMFENGDPNLPVYIGTRYHKDEPIPELNPKTNKQLIEQYVRPDKQQYRYHTAQWVSNDKVIWSVVSADYTLIRTPRHGHRIYIQDHPKLNYMQFYTESGHTMILHDNAKFVQIRSSKGSQLTLDDKNGYVYLSTYRNQGLLLDTAGKIGLASNSGRGIGIDDSAGQIVLTSGGISYTSKQHLTTSGELRKYDARFVTDSVMNKSSVSSANNPFIVIDSNSNQIILQAGSAKIVLDGNSGIVSVFQKLNVV